MQYPPIMRPRAAVAASSSGSAGERQRPQGMVSSPQPIAGLLPEADGIQLHHVICNSELLLKEVIGSGAEGKVKHHYDRPAENCSILLATYRSAYSAQNNLMRACCNRVLCYCADLNTPPSTLCLNWDSPVRASLHRVA